MKTLRTNSEVLSVLNESNPPTVDPWFTPRSSHPATEPPPNYQDRTHRAATFSNYWPLDAPISVSELVDAGLYYTGSGDKVTCAWCRGSLYNWHRGDTAIGEHKRHFPQCPFIQRRVSELLSGKVGETNERPHCNNGAINDEWGHSEAVRVVQQMGYDQPSIAQAIHTVKEIWKKSLSSETLLDALYELEDETDSDAVTKSKEQHGVTTSGDCSCILNSNSSEENVSLQKENAACNITEDNLHIRTHCDIALEHISTEADESQDNGSQHTAPLKRNDQEHNSKGVQKLIEENKKLKDSKTCKICLDNEVNLLLLPCRHLVCCEGCGDVVKHCPVCRTLIVATVKTYLA